MKGPPVSEKAQKLYQEWSLKNQSLALEDAKKWQEWSLKILDERGYANFVTFDLALPLRIKDHPEPEGEGLYHFSDGRPFVHEYAPADIVQVARTFCYSEQAIEHHERGEFELMARVMFYLGLHLVRAQILVASPGIPANILIDELGVADLFSSLASDVRRDQIRKDKGRVGTAQSKATQREARQPLYDKICEIGRMFKEQGVEDKPLTKAVIKYMFDHDIDGNKVNVSVPEKEREECLWKVLGKDKRTKHHGMTPPTVLKILRDGNVRP